MGLKMFGQQISPVNRIEYPGIHGIRIDLRLHPGEDFFLLIACQDEFGGSKTLQQFIGIVGRSFRQHEFAGGKIEKGQSDPLLILDMDSGQEIVGPMLQQFILDRCTRTNQVGDPSLHNAFGLFGVFQLIADRHTVSGFDQFV